MKTQAKIPIKKAVLLQTETARNNKQHNESYLKAVLLSSLTIQIGEILLLLLAGNGQPDGWQQLEQLLREFYGGGIL